VSIQGFASLFLLLPVVLPVRVAGAPAIDSSQQPREPSQTQLIQDQDPLKRPLKSKQLKANQERESKHYRDWANEVKLIITPEELAAFKKLSTDVERDNFIETFWQHRDPTPDTEENEYKEEFYRRKAYANEHFGSGIAGEFTDRGRMYILYGKPDSIESHPMGGPYLRPAEEGGGMTETHPFEIWRYRHLDGKGEEVTMEFVDVCGCGEYHRALNRSEKDALRYIPNAGRTDAEMAGMSTKADRLRDPEGLGRGFFNQDNGGKFFDRMEQYFALDRPPELRMVETDVKTTIHYNLLPFDVRVDFVRAALDTVLVPITVQIPNRELTFVNKDGLQRGVVNIFGRMTTLTGKVVQTFEDTVHLDVPPELLNQTLNNSALYWKALPMHPGHYRLDVVIKDVNGDKLGSRSRALVVPVYDDNKLTASSLILADVLEPVATSDIGSGSFVLGATKVRPKVQSGINPVSFGRGQRVNLWMQVYNLAMDQKTGRPAATIEYEVVKAWSSEPVVTIGKTTAQTGVQGHQLTLEESFRLSELPAGEYQLVVRVTDLISGQIVAPTVRFAVE